MQSGPTEPNGGRRPTGDGIEPVKRVLLVEDTPVDAVLVKEALGQQGRHTFALTHVTTVKEAERSLHQRPVDAILLDLNLSDSRGLTTVRRVHQAAPHTPIIVLTSCDDDVLGRRAIRCHAQDYIAKVPASYPQLQRTIAFAIERHRLLRKLAASEEQFRSLVRVSADGIVVVDRQNRVLLANPAAVTMCGERRLAVGEPFHLPVTCGRVSELTVGELSMELIARETRWEGSPARLITMHDTSERRLAEQEQRRLLAELQRANGRLEKLASLDPLTGLLNRRGLELALSNEMKRAKRTGSTVVGMLLDCDDFKCINDQLGHATGDAVLAQLAHRVRSTVRQSDYVARVGGDEFFLLLPETNLWEGIRFADRVRLAICSTPFLGVPRPITLTASTGVCRIPHSSLSIEEVLPLTRIALNQSKAAGKNRVSADAETRTTDERNRVVERLSRDDVFRVVSQQIIRLEDGAVSGYELLSRCSIAGFEAPNDFFRVCLEGNILTLADLACLRESVAASKDLTERVRVHVNVFPSTILNTPTEVLLRTFIGAPVDTVFCLELSEQQFVGHPEELGRKLDALREAGIQIALDDVGFGRTSLELLVLVEPDIVKIEGEFVRRALIDRHARNALARLIRVIETLDAELVAEGIETREHFDLVRDSGVLYGQGYMWGMPC